MKSRYAVNRRVENAYLVRERDRRLVRELLGFVTLALIFSGFLLAYTWVHIEIVDAGYRIDRLETQLHGLHEEERRKILELSRITSPKRIEERALLQLGMRHPSPSQLFRYEDLLP